MPNLICTKEIARIESSEDESRVCKFLEPRVPQNACGGSSHNKKS